MSNLANQNPDRLLREGFREGEPPPQPKRKTKADVSSSSAESRGNTRTNIQKNWFEEYIYSTEWPVLGTLGKWLTLKPVEGAVTAVTGSNVLGKVARVGAIGGAVYLSTPYVMDAFAAAEGAASGPGLDWLSRLNQSRGKLGTGTPRGLTPTPPVPGQNVPYEFR